MTGKRWGIFSLILVICLLTVTLRSADAFASGQSGNENTTSLETTGETVSEETTKKENHVWPKAPSIAAKTAVLMDQETGTVLYGKKQEKKKYPASLTKLMTALLVIEHCSLDEKVTFSDDAIYKTEGSSVGIKPGEILSVEDCLYALMLESANEVGYALAEHVGGTVDAFVDMMNERAEELGCVNTHFTNPHGLFDENHYTCAYDLALISREVLKNPLFRTIIYTQTYQISKTNLTKETRYLNNHHQMRYASKFPQYRYKYCIGGKTGYTELAGYTLATFAKKDGMTLICIVLDSGSPYDAKNEYTDSISLLDFGYKSFLQAQMSPEPQKQDIALPSFGKGNALFDQEQTILSVEESVPIVIPKEVPLDQVTQRVDLYDKPKVEQGQTVLGQVIYELEDHTLGASRIFYTAPVLLTKPQEELSASLLGEASSNEKPFHLSTGMRICLIVVILLIAVVGGLFLYQRLVVVPKRRALSNRAQYFNSSNYRAQSRSSFRRKKKRQNMRW